MSSYNPGIASLAGYYFQIKVFISLLYNLQIDDEAGYEFLDDVSIIEDEDSSYSFIKSKKRIFYQVKRTNVPKDKIKKTLYNWLLADDADEYHLLIAPSYVYDDEYLKEDKIQSFYDELLPTEGQSLQTKVFNIYKKNNQKDFFIKKMTHIIKHLKINNDYNPDDEIVRNYKFHFHFNACYNYRIKAFVEKITYNVLESINKGNPYIITGKICLSLIEEICNSINEDNYEIDYQEFIRNNPVELNNELKETREYKQLALCKLPENVIINRLQDCYYYNDFRNFYWEHNKKSKINNIEATALSNFEDAKIEIDEDTPKKRYTQTIKKQINELNKMQSNGTYISLTKDDDKRISWKD